jgi:hypothetical protein
MKENLFFWFLVIWFSLMFLAGIHRRTLRSRIVKRMIEDSRNADDIEKALKAYDGEEE